MRKLVADILGWFVKKLARLTMWRYRPGIVGVTGSVGKTSTKRAIAAVLSSDRRVRSSRGNLNNELGLSLAILGDWNDNELRLVSRDEIAGKKQFRKFFFWVKVIIVSTWWVIFKRKEYPEILILEYGVDRPGDMKKLLSIARPNVGVITAVGDIPVHVEFFTGPEEVAREKAKIIEYLPVAGYAVLNADDDTVYDLKDRTRGHMMTFGFSKRADVKATRFENRSDISSDEGRPIGVSFKLEYGGSFVPVRLDGVFGKTQGYASAAAAAVGLIFGLNLVRISEALQHYDPAPSRMQLLPGIKYSYIIDDSYNASPLSMHAALETLHSLPAKRRVAVLGDMLEIGKYTLEAHEYLGRLAAKYVDILVTVGPRARFIAESARNAGFSKKNILSFETSEDAKRSVKDLMKKGDIVLIKGSHAMELQKVVEELKAF